MSRRIPVAVAVAVFALALAALLALGNGHREPKLPRQAAVRAALADPVISRQLSRHGYDRSRVTALDGRLARVTFFDGPSAPWRRLTRRGGWSTPRSSRRARPGSGPS